MKVINFGPEVYRLSTHALSDYISISYAGE